MGAESRAPRAITARRAEVLRELADGYSGRWIAERLGLSVSRVRDHIEGLRTVTGQPGVRERSGYEERGTEARLLELTC